MQFRIDPHPRVLPDPAQQIRLRRALSLPIADSGRANIRYPAVFVSLVNSKVNGGNKNTAPTHKSAWHGEKFKKIPPQKNLFPKTSCENRKSVV